MDIKIEALGHNSQLRLQEFYVDTLNKKYGKYDFVKSIDVKIKDVEDKKVCVSLQLKPEKGTMLYVEGQDVNENVALRNAIRKMNVRIEKYKEKHYHNVHTMKNVKE